MRNQNMMKKTFGLAFACVLGLGALVGCTVRETPDVVHTRDTVVTPPPAGRDTTVVVPGGGTDREVIRERETVITPPPAPPAGGGGTGP
jgi:hypothetical protein